MLVTTLQSRLELVRDFVNTVDLETAIDNIATTDELAEWLSEADTVEQARRLAAAAPLGTKIEVNV